MDWRDDLKLFAGCLLRVWLALAILAIPVGLAIACRLISLQDTGPWR